MAWGYAQPIGNRLCSTEKDSESGTTRNGSQHRSGTKHRPMKKYGQKRLEAEVKGFACDADKKRRTRKSPFPSRADDRKKGLNRIAIRC